MAGRRWPDELLGRLILVEGFEYSRAEAIERTPMDSGLARARVFNSNPLALVPVRHIFDELQVAFYKAWKQEVALHGGAWFDVDLPLEGKGYRTVLARIVRDRLVPLGNSGRMKLLAELELHDTLVLPEGIVDLVLAFGAEGTQTMAAALMGVTLRPFLDAWSDFAEAA